MRHPSSAELVCVPLEHESPLDPLDPPQPSLDEPESPPQPSPDELESPPQPSPEEESPDDREQASRPITHASAAALAAPVPSSSYPPPPPPPEGEPGPGPEGCGEPSVQPPSTT